MNYRPIVLATALLAGVGCNRQDAETLGRIGHKLMQRAKEVTPVKGGKDRLTVSLPGFTPEVDGPDEK